MKPDEPGSTVLDQGLVHLDYDAQSEILRKVPCPHVWSGLTTSCGRVRESAVEVRFSITPPKVGRVNAQGSKGPLFKLVAAQRYAGLDVFSSVPLTIEGCGCD